MNHGMKSMVKSGVSVHPIEKKERITGQGGTEYGQ